MSKPSTEAYVQRLKLVGERLDQLEVPREMIPEEGLRALVDGRAILLVMHHASHTTVGLHKKPHKTIDPIFEQYAK